MQATHASTRSKPLTEKPEQSKTSMGQNIQETPTKISEAEALSQQVPNDDSQLYQSAERFKQNEKHLSEGRLKNESKMDIPLQSTVPVLKSKAIEAVPVSESQPDLPGNELKRNVSQNNFQM